MMLLDDSGFRVPWKTPLPLEKKAPRAFLMLTSIHLALESEVDHQAPRHLAELEIGISMLSTLMADLFVGMDGDITASHFSVLRVRLLEVAKVLTDEI